jgi:hypothetical protein
MRDERETVALSVEDELLAAEIHDAVWMGDDESETVQRDAPGVAKPEERAPRSRTPRDD